jgi:hypothetical protein
MCKFTAAAVATFMFAATAYGYSDAAAKDAEQLLERARAARNNGTGSSSDVALAEYNLVEMQYKAHQITCSQYCQSAMQILHVLVSLAQNQVIQGASSVEQEIETKRRFYETEAFCRRK